MGENATRENEAPSVFQRNDAVRCNAEAFSQAAEQSDDMTVSTLKAGALSEATATVTVPARLDQLTRVNEFIHAGLEQHLCPSRAQNQLDVAVEELFVNIVHYGYPDATPENPGMVRISYTYSAEPPSVTIDIADDGIPFNPLERPDVVMLTVIEDIPIGGLGVLLAKHNVDEMRYERMEGSNVISIVKKW